MKALFGEPLYETEKYEDAYKDFVTESEGNYVGIGVTIIYCDTIEYKNDSTGVSCRMPILKTKDGRKNLNRLPR